jgi:replication factor C small subunit
LLQAASALGKVTRESVYEASVQAKPEDVKDMLNLALKGKFAESRKKLYEMLINQGLSAEDIIKDIHRQLFDLDITEKSKIELVEKVGEYEFRLNQGGSPEVQIEALLAQFLKHGK